MELRVLKYFLAVAREENISRAAETLHITQPTLSRQLMQLEDELSTQLFVRGKNKMSLTNEGMLLRRRAQEMIDLAEKTTHEFLWKEELVTGIIDIGSGETYTMKRIADVMKEFHDTYPQVTYHLYSGNADDVKEKLDRGLIDIGLLAEPVDIEKYEFLRLSQKDVWGILMRKDHPLANKEYIEPYDLIHQDILCSHRDLVLKELEHWFGEVFQQIQIVSTYNLVYNASLMVEAGIGMAICFEKLININEETNLIFKRLSPRLETGTVIVWKKYQVFSPATTHFLDMLKLHFKENNAL